MFANLLFLITHPNNSCNLFKFNKYIYLSGCNEEIFDKSPQFLKLNTTNCYTKVSTKMLKKSIKMKFISTDEVLGILLFYSIFCMTFRNTFYTLFVHLFTLFKMQYPVSARQNSWATFERSNVIFSISLSILKIVTQIFETFRSKLLKLNHSILDLKHKSSKRELSFNIIDFLV